ncbi:sortase [Candidatus Dojkabacteria bacterium]|nr:sortase [Candidatus Dojkabacteria bacterium]
MFGGNRGIVLTILLVVIISVASLVGVVYALIQSLNELNFGEVNAFTPDREVEIIGQNYNYNFAVPSEQEGQVEPVDSNEQENEEETESASEEAAQDSDEAEPIPEYNYNFPIPKITSNPQMKSIQIPTISYNSPVVVSDNADTGIDHGAWYYPSNHPSEGEAIFLCHRRYFASEDPKSCWYLDKVKNGDYLYLNLDGGRQYTYQVSSVSVADGSDISIYHTSDEEILKLISCAKEDGKIGSDSHRIVLIAHRVG